LKEVLQVTYETKYKFLVSLGVLFIISPFVLTCYMFTVSRADFLYSIEQYKLLTTASKQVVDTTQCFYQHLIPICIILIGLGIIVGGVFIRKGLKDWQPFQDFDLERNRLTLQQLSTVTSKEKASIQDRYKESEISVSYRSYYQFTEDKIVRRIYETAPDEYKVITNQKLNSYYYDIIALGKKFFVKDIIFEIKYLNRNIDNNLYENYIQVVDRLFKSFSKETNRRSHGKLLIITENSNFEQVKKFVNDKKTTKIFTIEVINRNEIEGYNFFS